MKVWPGCQSEILQAGRNPLPAGAGRPSRLPGLVPADEVLSLSPEKVPKERVQGENPLDTPRSVGVRPSITGVAKLAVAQLPSTASGLVRTYA